MAMTRPPSPGAILPDLKVLVLAGSDTDSASVQEPPGGDREVPLAGKAFLRLHGQLVIEYVLDVLRDSGLTQVWVLAPDRHLAQIPGRHRFTPVSQQPGARFFANMSAGLAAMGLRAGEPALLAFGDHPLTSAAALHHFLLRCAGELDQADFFHALALQSQYREFAPWFTRTSVHMREMSGRASGFTLAIPSRLRRLNALGELYGVRKLERVGSLFGLLLQLTRTLGADAPSAVLDGLLLYLAKEMEKAGRGSGAGAPIARRLELWLAARVPLRRLERYAIRVLGAERGVRLVPLAHGGTAIDVDFAKELRMLEDHWDELRQISARQDAALGAR
jgi:hypothetical protein